MQPGGTGRYGRQIRSLKVTQNADVPGDHVDNRSGNKEGGNTTGAAVGVFRVGVFDHGQAADSRSHHHTHPLGVGFGNDKPGVI